MAEGLKPARFNPIPTPMGTGAPVAWEVDQGRRLVPGGGVNGAAGDGPGGIIAVLPGPFAMPFTAQPGPVYSGAQIGGRLNPRQPLRANAGIARQNAMYPTQLYAHQYGGAKSLGVPVTSQLKAQMAALMAIRARQAQLPAPGSSLGGTGIGTRMGAMIGAPFSQVPKATNGR